MHEAATMEMYQLYARLGVIESRPIVALNVLAKWVQKQARRMRRENKTVVDTWKLAKYI